VPFSKQRQEKEPKFMARGEKLAQEKEERKRESRLIKSFDSSIDDEEVKEVKDELRSSLAKDDKKVMRLPLFKVSKIESKTPSRAPKAKSKHASHYEVHMQFP
jgi:Zn-dependent M16 (insulinase) family peptidase